MKFVSCSLALLATFVAGTHAAWNEDLSSHNAIANAKFVADAVDEGENLQCARINCDPKGKPCCMRNRCRWNASLEKYRCGSIEEQDAVGLRGAANSVTSVLGDYDEMDEEHDVPSLKGAIFLANAIDEGELEEEMDGDHDFPFGDDCAVATCEPDGPGCCFGQKCIRASSYVDIYTCQ